MGLVWPPLLCARPLPVRQLLRGMCPEEPPRAGAVGEDISAVRVLRRLPLHVTCVGGGGLVHQSYLPSGPGNPVKSKTLPLCPVNY